MRPYIVGLGAVTGYGWGTDALWAGIGSGRPAATVHEHLGAGLGPTWLARIPAGGDDSDGENRFTRAARAAAREAVSNARTRGWRAGGRVGIIHATVIPQMHGWQNLFAQRDAAPVKRQFVELMPSTTVSMIAQEFGFTGPSLHVNAMCASGGAAVLTARAWLAAGVCSDVLVLAADLSSTPQVLRGFIDLGVCVGDEHPLSACRPYRDGSRGFIFGEAAVAMLLSAGPGDAPYLQVLGGAMSQDAYSAVSIDPSLSSLRRAFTDALADAGVAGSRVVYLNGHGPGTRQADAAERRLRDELLPAARMFSFKPLLAHCQGAAAAVEILTQALCADRGRLCVADTDSLDPALVPGPEPARHGVTVKSSIGLGGHNSVVVLRTGPGEPGRVGGTDRRRAH